MPPTPPARARSIVLLLLAVGLVAGGAVVLAVRSGGTPAPGPTTPVTPAVAASPSVPGRSTHRIGFVAAGRAGDSSRPAERSGRRAEARLPRARSARATERLFMHRLVRRDPALCATLTRAGAARLRSLVAAADYPVPRHASCAYAASRLGLVLGRGWGRRLLRAAGRAPLRRQGRVLSATFRVPGIRPLQHLRLRRVGGQWMIERVPGAWAEGPRPAAD